jgi:hypothetical protein
MNTQNPTASDPDGPSGAPWDNEQRAPDLESLLRESVFAHIDKMFSDEETWREAW